MLIETIHPRFSEINAVGHIGFTVLRVWFEKSLVCFEQATHELQRIAETARAALARHLEAG